MEDPQFWYSMGVAFASGFIASLAFTSVLRRAERSPEQIPRIPPHYYSMPSPEDYGENTMGDEYLMRAGGPGGVDSYQGDRIVTGREPLMANTLAHRPISQLSDRPTGDDNDRD